MVVFLALTGSILGSYSVSAMIRGYIGIHEAIYGTISGGILIGTVGSLINNPGAAITIGLIAGIISTAWFVYVFPWINRHKIYDSNGYSGLYMINSLVGGLLIGPIIAASYVGRN